jgi:RimJ/RimL family protein N-acetyltransferase
MRTLSSRSLHLQKVQTEDLSRMNELRKLVSHAPSPHSREETPLTIDELSQRQSSFWLIVDRKTNEDLGAISLQPFGEDGAKQIGFVIKPDARGKGVLSSVLPAFVKCLGLELYSETDERDRAGIRVLEKCGFQSCVPAHAQHKSITGEKVRSAGFRFEPTEKARLKSPAA